MSAKLVLVAALCFALSFPHAQGYRILGVFPLLAKSHFYMSGVIMRELAARGHEVVVISPFPEKIPPGNYKDIALKERGSLVGAFDVGSFNGVGIVAMWRLLYSIGVEMCEHTYSSPKVQNLLKSNEKFDLVMMEIFNTECYLPLAHRFNASIVGISSSAMVPWANERFGNPDNPSYIPTVFSGYSDKMTFTERLANTLILWSSNLMYKYFFNAKANEIVRRHLGGSVPTVEELADRVSLFIINTHLTAHYPRPLVPAVVEVGGIHVKKPERIPQEFEKFLNESSHGAIYFSLGSCVRSDSLPEEMRKGFLEAFSELPQRVLWKWESESMPDQPSNVMLAKWMPQLGILSHPNVKAFITHGGLMGTTEAVYFGVPMVAIPLFGDQFFNVKSYADKGIAVQLNYDTISKKTILAALKEVLENPSYAENARRVSKAFRDVPMPPLDTAIYWIEYVIRHGGARHLRSAVADLTWYQYLLLDVIAVVFLAAATVVALVVLLCRTVARKIFRDTQQRSPAKQMEKHKSS